MANKEKNKEKENKAADRDSSSKPAEVKIAILTWVIMIAVIGLLSGSGFFLGRLLASPSQPVDAAVSEEGKVSPSRKASPSDTESSPKTADGTWYYNDLDSVVVNPDEPGATRFVRVGLILEISNELSEGEATKIFQAKKPLLINWLNLYFKSLSLDQMENERDMKRILSQICDGFNGILFPEAKPQIKNVLIREFNIQ